MTAQDSWLTVYCSLTSGAFDLLVKDGADFQQIDNVMSKFGWPMGPAYLIDVVGIDTGVHGAEVMAEGFLTV